MESSSADQQRDCAEADISELLNGCGYCLGQCQQLLEQLSEEDYVRSQSGHSSVGAHMRHVLERFQSFLSGLASSRIDYDARKRDPELEKNRSAASFALASVCRRLRAVRVDENTGKTLTIAESVHPDLKAVQVSSSLQRELMSLVSHSTHHLAIIAMLIEPLGYQLGDEFGKAPSTLIHESRK